MKMRTFWAAAAAAVGSCVVSIAILGVPGAESGGGTLKVYNWGEYIDEDVITQFEDETGISVVYDVFETNEEMYPVVEAGGVKYDVVCPSDYMIQRMIDNNMLAELDYDNIPNADQIGDPYWKMSQGFDPDNKYSVPYCWGTVGILYNKTMVDEPVDSWSILWDEKYADSILMQDSVRDAFMVALKKDGFSANSTDETELQQAKQDLIDQKPLIQAYVIDQVRDKMIGGEAAIGVYYSGDAITMIDDNPDLAWVFPEEGSVLSVDCMAVPATSEHKEAAEMFINFMCEPDIGKANAEYIGYTTPMQKVWDILDEDLKYSEIAYPSEEVEAKEKVFTALSDEVNNELDVKWSEMKSYNEGGSGVVFLMLLLAMVALACFNIWRKLRKKTRNQY